MVLANQLAAPCLAPPLRCLLTHLIPWPIYSLGPSIPFSEVPPQDHDIYTKRLSSSGSPIDEGQQKKVGPTGPEKVAREVNGTECGSCYGAERGPEDCCNTCAEVRGY